MSRPVLHQAHYVLHPTDFTQASERAFAHALRIALFDEARLTLLHVERDRQDIDWGDYPSVRNTLERWELIEPGTRRHQLHRKLGISVEKVVAEGSNVGQSILRYIDHSPVDLIVLATHGREGLPRWLHPSVAEPVARKSRIPTLFVPYDTHGFVDTESGTVRLDRVLVPVDHQPSPQRGVDAALEALDAFGHERSQLTILHAGQDATAPAVTIPADCPWQVDRLVRGGSPTSTILQMAADTNCQLIVTVTAGHDGFLDALRGSTTEQLVRASPCPVLAVPARPVEH